MYRVKSGTGLGHLSVVRPLPAHDLLSAVHPTVQAKQQAHLRNHMAEESKNEYAAQLQRYNRDHAHFYFSQMPQIFDVSALKSLLTKNSLAPTRVLESQLLCPSS